MSEPFRVGDDWLDRGDLPYPDWTAVADRIAARPAEAHADCWTDATREWLTAFAAALGPDFGVHETDTSQVLGAMADGHADWLARCAHRHWQLLLDQLPGVADFTQPGKLVLIHLPDAEWYYAHVGRFYPETGEFGGPGGMHIRSGYPHVVLAGRYPDQIERTVAHELTHVGLAHLGLPLWLEEGLTQLAEENVGPTAGPLDEDDLRKHRRHWSRNGLGAFWWGTGFTAPGAAQKRSYQLAHVLGHILVEDHRPGWFGGRAKQRRLTAFVTAARAADAGQAAAVERVGMTVGRLAGKFLGAGDWEPGDPPAATSFSPCGWSRLPPAPRGERRPRPSGSR